MTPSDLSAIEWEPIANVNEDFARLDEDAERLWVESFRVPAEFLVVLPRRTGKSRIFALYSATFGLSSLPIEALKP